MKNRKILIFVLLSSLLISVTEEAKNPNGFVEEVACSSDGITVVLNKLDPEVAKYMANPKSQPVVYVYGHKTRHPCGTSMKNEKGSVNFNLTIPYGKECDVSLVDLQPNHRTAETTIVLEDNADLTYSKSLRINHVFCIYARSVQTIRFNDVSNGHEIIASTGGKPKPKVEMLFRSADGKSLRAAKIGDTVEFFVALSPDMAYHGMSPKECVFSDREDINSPDAKKMTFVQSGCPVDEISEIIDPLANVNDLVYFSKFKTFRFGNQSTVFAHCILQVCLKRDECTKSCYKNVMNSNLTAERLRFRHKRSAENSTDTSNFSFDTSEIALTNTLTILTDNESKELVSMPSYSPTPKQECSISTGSFGGVPFYTLAILITLLITMSGIAGYLGYKLKRRDKDSFDMMSAYSNAAFSVPVSYSIQRSTYGARSMDNYHS